MDDCDISSEGSEGSYSGSESEGSAASITEELGHRNIMCKVDITSGTSGYRTLSIDADNLLSNQSLLDVSISQCCRRNCILNLSPQRYQGNMSGGVEAIRCARLPLARLSSEKQYDLMKGKMEGNTS